MHSVRTVLQQICSQQPVVFVHFNSRLPVFRTRSETLTIAEEFGEIADDIRRARNCARYFGQSPGHGDGSDPKYSLGGSQ
jgi:hypothetical protein